MAQSDMAMKSFSLTNDIVEITPQDEIYKYDKDEDKRINTIAPWAHDPHYFKSCRISAVALIKMVIHARSGVPWEIMGLMQGKVVGNSLVIMDSFALPVQGTETRVNAANEANEYMVEYMEEGKKVGRVENAIGWYHSHPGYGCWLSGIDVNTQSTNQKYMDPFVAVVIDPNRTISAGKVDIGAFRTYPEDYKPPSGAGGSEYQSIPLSKIEDFGVHANSYYQLDVSIFKSSLDDKLLGLLWNKYWVNTLSQSPLISNRAYAVSQLQDLHQKLAKATSSVASSRASLPASVRNAAKDKGKEAAKGSAESKLKAAAGEGSGAAAKGGMTAIKGKEPEKDNAEDKKKEDTPLAKGVRDGVRIASEAQHGLIAQVLKDVIFSVRPGLKEADFASGGGANPATRRVGEVVDTVMTST